MPVLNLKILGVTHMREANGMTGRNCIVSNVSVWQLLSLHKKGETVTWKSVIRRKM
jgi:hypothetical protein